MEVKPQFPTCSSSKLLRPERCLPMELFWNATYGFMKPKPFIFQAMSNSTHFKYVNKLHKNETSFLIFVHTFIYKMVIALKFKE